MNEVSYQQGCKLLDEHKWSAAIAALEKIKGYKDADDQLKEAKYQKACGYLAACKYEKAMEIFAELGDYKDSMELINGSEVEQNYQKAKACLNENKYAMAEYLLMQIGDYKDAEDISKEIPNQCKKYIDEKVNGQMIMDDIANSDKVDEYGQVGIDSITTPFSKLQKIMAENGDTKKDAKELAKVFVEWIDTYTIPGYISFLSMGDLPHYSEDNVRLIREGINFQKDIAREFWNIAQDLDRKDEITVNEVLILLSDEISDTLNNISAWLKLF